MNLTCLTLGRLLTKVFHAQVLRRRFTTIRETPEVLVWHWRRVFQDHGVPEPQESSEILIAHALGAKTFHSLARHLARSPVSTDQMTHIEMMAQERLKRVPVQYIIGEWDFLDMTLRMKPPVFIPRPETEELVRLVVAACPQLHQSAEPSILEVGCGSGAVSLALLRSVAQARVVAIDKSEAAVRLSQENAERLDLQHRIQILQHDILSDSAERLLVMGPVDVLVSNPPYIFTEDMAALDPEILRYEDHVALDGGPDGMDVMRALLHLAPRLLKPGGNIFLEGDPRHPEMLHQWLNNHPELPLQLISVMKDFCGRDLFTYREAMSPSVPDRKQSAIAKGLSQPLLSEDQLKKRVSVYDTDTILYHHLPAGGVLEHPVSLDYWHCAGWRTTSRRVELGYNLPVTSLWRTSSSNSKAISVTGMVTQ